MRLITGRNHAHFNLDGGMPQGVGYVVRPAKDPIALEPEDERIVVLLKRTLCRARRHEGEWEVTSVTGTVKTLSYSASYAQWKHVCENLLLESLLSPSSDQDVG